MTGGGLLFIQSHLLDWYIQNKTVWVGGSLERLTFFFYICVSETHFDVETQTISARQGV